jgi:hypothetical protein
MRGPRDALDGAAFEYQRTVAAKGRPPTPKQFARVAVDGANQWLGGDLAAVCGAIGVPSPVQPQRVALMPDNRERFVELVFEQLGGQPVKETDSWRQRELFQRQWLIGRMCSNALRYVQLQEALGRPPEPKDIGADKWGDSANRPDWECYQQVIARSLSDLGVTTLS